MENAFHVKRKRIDGSGVAEYNRDMDEKKRAIRLAARVKKRMVKKHALRSVFFELTNACNLRCLHCGSSCGEEKGVFLSVESVEKTLRSVKENVGTEGILVVLTGGEPLLHPDFFEIVRLINDLGFRWGMTTNATLITEEAAKKIAEGKIFSVAFSLDGTKETDNFLRNDPTAYDRAVKGIKNGLKAFGRTATTMITTVVHKKNIGELDRIFEEVKALGVDMWRPINIEPIGRANGNGALFLDREEYMRLLDYIVQKRKKNSAPIVIYGCSHALPDGYEGEVRDWYFTCHAGVSVASVLCNGDIYACLDIERRPELVQGNVAREDFFTVWTNDFAAFRRDRSDCNYCKGCKDRAFCRGDSAHTWNYDANEPMLCLRNLLERGRGDHVL